MARTARECPTVLSQAEGTEEPEIDPRQEEKQMTQKAKLQEMKIWLQTEGLEPKNETVAQEGKEENSNAEYANMEIPQAWTIYQNMMSCKVVQKIQWVC